MEYLYDPTTKLCFSFLADDRDESMLEINIWFEYIGF